MAIALDTATLVSEVVKTGYVRLSGLTENVALGLMEALDLEKEEGDFKRFQVFGFGELEDDTHDVEIIRESVEKPKFKVYINNSEPLPSSEDSPRPKIYQVWPSKSHGT